MSSRMLLRSCRNLADATVMGRPISRAYYRSSATLYASWAALGLATLTLFAILSLNAMNVTSGVSITSIGIEQPLPDPATSLNAVGMMRGKDFRNRHLFTEKNSGPSQTGPEVPIIEGKWIPRTGPIIEVLKAKHIQRFPENYQIIDATSGIAEGPESNMSASIEAIRQRLVLSSEDNSTSNANLNRLALDIMPKELKDRRQHLGERCAELGLMTTDANPWEFAINPEYHLVYCNVFKAASTSWITVFNQLTGLTELDLKSVRKTPVSIMRMIYPRPSNEQLQEAMQDSLSFIVVRDPFERLLSAYRDKFESAKNGHYKMIGAMMAARKHGYNYALHHGPTFSDFVDYVLSTEHRGHRLDEHWAPYYRFCTPCSLNFTVIAKTETLERDSMFILETVGVPHNISVRKWNSNSKGKTQTLLRKYYSELSESQLEGLLSLYYPDFALFGYDFKPYVDWVSKGGTKNKLNNAP
ncbi:unnamed protein product [Notodromas monacha]|uniref:Carbohydrate sulfotransferase n=1 Tax=Notodromas monacha TaxID=399045 RepID=A0A7R9BIV5_9CRUS|nr:unnamed protein product [Notodromas monacha]CAG0915512.1 unnamed protein product [Notodromas monacha]